MTDAILAALFVGASIATPPVTGWATYYNPGVMQQVVENRIAWGQIASDECPDCVGYAAMLYPSDLGRTVCVTESGRTFGPFLVVDAAAGHHRAKLIADGWIIDLDRPIWDAMGLPEKPTIVTVEDC